MPRGEQASWDLYRTFDAVVRLDGFTAAARTLGTSQSTVSRHLAALEEAAGTPLIVRGARVTLTERGAALHAAIAPMIDAATAARAALESTSEVRGHVTVATVGELVRWVLAPRLGDFVRAYPHLRLTLLAQNHLHSLAAGEADVALRMTRPARGDVVARRLATTSFGFFAASSLPLAPDVPWLGLTGSLARIAEQRHAEQAFAGRPPRLLLEDVDSLGAAVEAGLGVAVLPRPYAARLAGVIEIRPARAGARDLGAIPSRATWLVVHKTKRALPKVRAVVAWLEAALGATPAAR